MHYILKFSAPILFYIHFSVIIKIRLWSDKNLLRGTLLKKKAIDYCIVAEDFTLRSHLYSKKASSTAGTAPPHLPPSDSSLSVRLDFNLKPIKIVVSTFSQSLFPNIKLKTLTNRVHRLHLLAHSSSTKVLLIKMFLSLMALEVASLFSF